MNKNIEMPLIDLKNRYYQIYLYFYKGYTYNYMSNYTFIKK